MLKPTRKPDSQTRRSRTDGEATRSRIIDAAGQVFAERGYHDTTSKEICKRAGVNLAAVNYHFGSRDGLYLAVVGEVMSHLLELEYLQQIAASDKSAADKLGEMIDGLVHSLIEDRSWHTRVWAREILTPSPVLAAITATEAMPRIEIVLPLLSDLTGIPSDDPRRFYGLLGLMSPCLMLLIIDPDQPTPIQSIYSRPADEIADHIKRFIFSGLRSFAETS
ncbi:TetR/AcrR family transcriptional regulator [Marinobacterium sp. YM272]|uniref:TetR/AcrR family transcriptional regulator n=1 Tax=Marinobacterium sp. YM272 TaxID=3421654 RepID=UPI003D7F1D69